MRRLKILLIGINYAPDLIGISKYTTELAEWLVAEGHEIKVVTAPPYYPAWKIAESFGGFRYHREHRSGVEVYRCPIYVPKTPSGLKRLLHLFSFAITSLPMMIWLSLTFRPDMVFVIVPALSCAPGARFAAFLVGAKSWIHIQDFEVDAAFDLGLLRSRFLHSLALFVESLLLRSFSVASSISPQMLRLLKDKGCDGARVHELRNWVDLEAIFPIDGPNRYREEFGFETQDVLVLYSGNIGQKQGIEILPEVARKLTNEPHIHFLIVGDGAGKEQLVKASAGLMNMHFMPLQPLEQLNALLNAADIHVLPQRSGAADLVLPSKLTGMFASGRPVIATAEKGTGLALEIEGRGIVVTPGDVSAFASAISELAVDHTRRRELGALARSYAVEVFGRDTILHDFEENCLNVVQA